MLKQKIILASQSPRRKQLLEWAEIPFEIIVKETDERYPISLNKEEIAIYIAMNKARAVENFIATGKSKTNDVKGLPILSADTIVVLKDKIIGKPVNYNEAINILTELSGKTHIVITGVVILSQKKIISFADVTEVNFHKISEEQIKFYVEKYKPFDKAGAYAIQEWIGVVGIKSIKGDFYNVMGLPISRVVKELSKLS